MSHGQPASVLLHTVGYLLLHPPSYYPLITYWAGRRGKWVTASIAPTPIYFSNQASDTPPIRIAITLLGSPGSLLKLINSPPELCRCPSEQACSIPRNTHILLPGTFHAIINPDFCPIRRGGIFRCSQPVQGSIWKRGVTRWGKIGLFSPALVMLEGGGQLCRWQGGQASCKEAAGIQRNYLPALCPSWTWTGKKRTTGESKTLRGGSQPWDMLPTAVGARSRVPKCRMAGA